jgi:hypothetical protein
VQYITAPETRPTYLWSAFLVGLLARLRANGNLSAFDIGIGNLVVVTAFRRRIRSATFSLECAGHEGKVDLTHPCRAELETELGGGA